MALRALRTLQFLLEKSTVLNSWNCEIYPKSISCFLGVTITHCFVPPLALFFLFMVRNVSKLSQKQHAWRVQLHANRAGVWITPSPPVTPLSLFLYFFVPTPAVGVQEPSTCQRFCLSVSVQPLTDEKRELCCMQRCRLLWECESINYRLIADGER